MKAEHRKRCIGKLTGIFIAICFISFINYIPSMANGTSSGDSIEYRNFLKKHGSELLQDYRLPVGNDFSYWGTDRNTFFYKSWDTGEFKEPYWTKGDMNVDGVMDRCFILFHQNNKGAKLFCFISLNTEKYKILEVEEALNTMGVEFFKKFRDSPIPNQLLLFEFEGHGMAYVWSEDEQVLKPIWLIKQRFQGNCCFPQIPIYSV